MNAASGTKVKNLALAGLCTAFMAVVAPLSIPIGPISLTLSVLGVFFAGAMLTPGWAAASILAYICIGAVGLPVFANMAAGVLDQPLSGEEVLEAAEAARPRFTALVKACLEQV